MLAKEPSLVTASVRPTQDRPLLNATINNNSNSNGEDDDNINGNKHDNDGSTVVLSVVAISATVLITKYKTKITRKQKITNEQQNPHQPQRNFPLH